MRQRSDWCSRVGISRASLLFSFNHFSFSHFFSCYFPFYASDSTLCSWQRFVHDCQWQWFALLLFASPIFVPFTRKLTNFRAALLMIVILTKCHSLLWMPNSVACQIRNQTSHRRQKWCSFERIIRPNSHHELYHTKKKSMQCEATPPNHTYDHGDAFLNFSHSKWAHRRCQTRDKRNQN